ncbi:MAG TPA: hypothetical protein VGQ83_41745 [Polyangia bacterium]
MVSASEPAAVGVEEAIRAADPAVLVVEPRLLRRIIRQRHRLGRLGLQVPHDRCLALSRAELHAAAGGDRLGAGAHDLPDPVVLLPRPSVDPTDPAAVARALTALWRALFHSRVHLAFERRLADGALTDAAIRGRIHHIGQTEFDEIRLVLRQDNLLLPPYGDRGTFVEFAALFLELRHFDERALTRTFPTLVDHLAAVDAVLAADVDAAALLAATRPVGAARDPAVAAPARHPRAADAPAATADADHAAEVGNLVRAAILTLGAARRSTPAARATARLQIMALSERLADTILGAEAGPDGSRAAWLVAATDTLVDLADVAAGRGGPRVTVEARLLHDLQKACTEHDVRTVDAVGWALSLGRRAVVRSLPALRAVRIARHLRAAENKLARVHLPEADRRRVAELVHTLRHRADTNVRAALGPRIQDVLDRVGFVPTNVPEEVARRKLISELLDVVVERGTFGLSQLRDAVSRNNLKLPRLKLGELLVGDQLLKADRLLADALDGVYRRGEIYLRFLQKVSSVAFGTWLGRMATLYAVLPLGASFVLLEGLQHIVGPLLRRLHGHRVHLLTRPSFAVTAVAIFLLIHSPACRRGAHAGWRGVRFVLKLLCYDLPRWLFTRPLLRRLRESRPARLLWRYVLKPGVVALPALWLAPRLHLGRRGALVAAGALFLALDVALNSRLGRAVEEAVGDATVRAVHQVRARILPGLLALILGAFRGLVDGLERALYAVDEWLRFRQGESLLAQLGKGLFGVVWFFATYLIRIYVNLLIEPQINPIKHFPVVTVSHKIILPMSPTLLAVFRAPLMPLGPVIANGVGATTVVLLPGVFGFLVWEFKENWKLYRGDRAAALKPVRVGHHGEAMGALLRPGFHSGTVPKLYAKLRRATWRGDASVGKHQEAVHHTAEAVKQFVEREWVGLMKTTRRWAGGPVSVGGVELGSNRVRVELRAPAVAGASAWLVFEEQSGWILASLAPTPSWIDALDDAGRAVLTRALGGLYAMAGVQLVREQIEAELGAETPYDIADEGLVVWPGQGYGTEVVYDLRRAGTLRPAVRGEEPAQPPPALDGARLRFADHPLPWHAWVATWAEDAADGRGGDGPLLRGRR